MKLKVISLALMLCCLSSYGHAAQINTDEEIKNIPAKISNVYYCGSWRYQGQSGFYRIVYIEFHYGCSLLYIQWMLDRKLDDARTKILHTLSIKEFNADDHIELLFDKPECEKTRNGIKLTVIADSGHDRKKRKFEVAVFQKFGKYRINEAIIEGK